MIMTMSLGTVHIPEWARNLLSGVFVDANTLTFERELDKDEFQVMHRIVLAMGGRWNQPLARFVFPAKTDVESTIRHALAGREQPPPPPANPAGRWSTPPELAWEVIGQARIGRDTTVLDMCAGNGALAGLAIASGAKVYAVEEDDACGDYLLDRMKGLRKLWRMAPQRWIGEMSQYLEDRFDEAGAPKPKLQFQSIVMHGRHDDLLDVGFTWALWPYVAPGGVLVTVISAENWDSDHVRAVNFRAWCDQLAADVIPVSDKMYNDYGPVNDALLFVGEKDA